MATVPEGGGNLAESGYPVNHHGLTQTRASIMTATTNSQIIAQTKTYPSPCTTNQASALFKQAEQPADFSVI